jgi:fibronectin-binding autotransporter adhesin
MKSALSSRPYLRRGRDYALPRRASLEGVGRPASFRPRLEALEERALLSVTHYLVTDPADTAGSANDVTLRYAVAQAVLGNQTAVIDFSSTLAGQTITLVNTQTYTGLFGATGLAIGGTANVTVDGSAAPGLTIASSTLRLFAVYRTAFLGLNDLTLSGGTASASSGGAVYASGNFAATDCTFANNSAGSGGAVLVHTDTPQFIAKATILDCTFRGNTALFNGGAIFVAINSIARVTGSTFDGNTATTGGGIYCFAGLAILKNCTFANNSATGSLASSGGGVYNVLGTLAISSCTFSTNTADGFGGAVSDDTGDLEIDNSILANSPSGGDFFEATPLLSTVVGGNDLIGDGSFLNLFTNSLSGNAGLDPLGLQDNGGPTETIAFVASSQALNAGDVNLVPGSLTTDQRGAPRTVLGTVDIGAYEHVLPNATATTLTASPTSSLVGQSISFTATVTAAQGTPTGTVTFSIDGTPAATVELANGIASFSDSALAAGSHTVAAHYNGLTTSLAPYASSSSAPVSLTVTAPVPSAPKQPVASRIPLPGQRILTALAINDAVFVALPTPPNGSANAFVSPVNTFPLLPVPTSVTYEVALRDQVCGGMPSEIAPANLEAPAAPATPAPANDSKTMSLLELALFANFPGD